MGNGREMQKFECLIFVCECMYCRGTVVCGVVSFLHCTTACYVRALRLFEDSTSKNSQRMNNNVGTSSYCVSF